MKKWQRLTAAMMAAAVALAFCAGCGEGDSDSSEENEGEKTGRYESRKGDYVGALVEGKRHSEETLAVTQLNSELKQFNAMKGRWPKSLKELEAWREAPLPKLPKGLKYDYDPETGKLKAVPEK